MLLVIIGNYYNYRKHNRHELILKAVVSCIYIEMEKLAFVFFILKRDVDVKSCISVRQAESLEKHVTGPYLLILHINKCYSLRSF